MAPRVLDLVERVEGCARLFPSHKWGHRYYLIFFIIHIRTRHVSFSILIGRNSVAEWLIVASTYHLNSDPK